MSIFDQPLYFIAEVANAAQGLVDDSYKIIEAVATTGADAIKFQFYKYDVLAAPSYPKYNIYKKTFYTAEQRTKFIEKAKEVGLDVWVDIFDRWGLEVAKKNLKNINAVKIPPTVILDEDLVSDIMNLKLPTAVGVGGYEDSDIDFVLSGIKRFSNPILLMYGFQAFPTPIEDTSIGRIKDLKKKYSYSIGYADHVEGGTEMSYRLPEYAFFSGATVIEKHITLDRSQKGLDYFSSLEPDEFKKFVNNMRQCEVVYGTGQITNVQKDYLQHATRITINKTVKPGDLLFKKDILFRRTDDADYFFPNEVENIIPGVVTRQLEADSGLTKKDIKKARVGIIVVCRLDSKRLKNKALLKLNGITAIERCLLNCLDAKIPSVTVLATSSTQKDSKLKNYTLGGKVAFFKGSADDPALRMQKAAKKYGIHIIVRVTGDSPLISYELIDHLLQSHINSGADFSYYKNAPLGARPEIVNTCAITKLIDNAQTMGYSEYLSLFFKNNPDTFNLNEVDAPKEFSYPNYRLNLDYEEDYILQKKIFSGLKVKRNPVSLSLVIQHIKDNPSLLKINSDIVSVYKKGELKNKLDSITKIDE
jgi:N,N'-diacetyllegionaminate synthase|tara:strand:+ start:1389 stop:3155 length:1767 start_codon:yes stop_codon:yes gene_type:complete